MNGWMEIQYFQSKKHICISYLVTYKITYTYIQYIYIVIYFIFPLMVFKELKDKTGRLSLLKEKAQNSLLKFKEKTIQI